jgi:hypothetical protein
LDRWWELSNEEQGKDVLFPQLEKLSIVDCPNLKALPEATLLGESYGTMARSAFPALKELKLKNLQSFECWEAVEGTQKGQIVFPKLEELTIEKCHVLKALPEAPSGEDYSVARSTFPALKKLFLYNLQSLESWEAVKGTQKGHIVFSKLEKLTIEKCPVLKALWEAPSGGDYSTASSPFSALKFLELENTEEDMFLLVAIHRTSLINVNLRSFEDTETTLAAAGHRFTQMVDGMEKGNLNDFPLADMRLTGLKSGVTELCACFLQLQELGIVNCDALVHWPEKEFQHLVSLRRLLILECSHLVGYAQGPAPESSTTSESSSQLLPRLKSLCIDYCVNMVERYSNSLRP